MKMVDAINTSAAGFGLSNSINNDSSREVSRSRENNNFDRVNFDRSNNDRRSGRDRDTDRVEISNDARIAANDTLSRGRFSTTERVEEFSNFRNFFPQALNRAAEGSNSRIALDGRFGQARDRVIEIRERIIARFQDRFGGNTAIDDPTTDEPTAAETPVVEETPIENNVPNVNESEEEIVLNDSTAEEDTTTVEETAVEEVTAAPIPGDPNAAEETAPVGNPPSGETEQEEVETELVENTFGNPNDDTVEDTTSGIGTGGGTTDEEINTAPVSEGIGIGGGSADNTTTGSVTGTANDSTASDTVVVLPADETSIGSTVPEPTPELTPVQIQNQSVTQSFAPTTTSTNNTSGSAFVRFIDI